MRLQNIAVWYGSSSKEIDQNPLYMSIYVLHPFRIRVYSLVLMDVRYSQY